jgi:hypothetical protein
MVKNNKKKVANKKECNDVEKYVGLSFILAGTALYLDTLVDSDKKKTNKKNKESKK